MQEKSNFPTLESAEISPNTRVLVRVDFNVPVVDGAVRDGFRIERSLRTINFLREKGARVILMSHITSVDTLESVSDFLSQFVSHIFIKDFDSAEGREQLNNLKAGEVALLENLRLNKGEESNDREYAHSLASLADVYINDAFSVSHRSHASVVGVPEFLSSYAGFLLEEEIVNLERVLSPEHPFLFILGGAKFETKIPLVKRFIRIADSVLIGGALANDVYRSRGWSVGTSLVSNVDIAEIANSDRIVVPGEVVVRRDVRAVTIPADEVRDRDLISDASSEWMESMRAEINNAKTILWNGPLGNYEAGFTESSETLARLVADSPAFSIVGGGDTVALIEELGIKEGFGFISTGGGAMLDFLSSGTLPGIEALKSK